MSALPAFYIPGSIIEDWAITAMSMNENWALRPWNTFNNAKSKDKTIYNPQIVHHPKSFSDVKSLWDAKKIKYGGRGLVCCGHFWALKRADLGRTPWQPDPDPSVSVGNTWEKDQRMSISCPSWGLLTVHSGARTWRNHGHILGQ